MRISTNVSSKSAMSINHKKSLKNESFHQKFSVMRMFTGFTLIELIIVIVIIGILAAIAIPRFINQTSSARIASLNGLAGAINSASALVIAQYKAAGNTTATSVTMDDGTSVTVTASTGIPTAAGIISAVKATGFTGSASGNVATFVFSTAVSNCNVTYTNDGTSTSGVTSVVNTGC